MRRGEACHFAVVGDPVAHSKSPAMHAAAYRALGLPHTYGAIRATPAELPGLVAMVRERKLGGFNVTVPHKLRILEHVDVIDASAASCGAANTIVAREDGSVVAYNTDAPALAEELSRLAPERVAPWSTARALVLGTGGASRSAVAALALLGVARIVVRGRAHASAEGRAATELDLAPIVASRAPRVEIVAERWAPSAETERGTLAIIQATSVGMEGAAPGEIAAEVVAWSALPPGAVALDVVYAPRETAFLRSAAARALRSANGIGMLARQGALAFELWLGIPAPYDAMRAALN